MCFDNEALYDIALKTMKLKTASYANLNFLISNVMSGITCSLRFPGQLNSDLRKLAVNLIPYPRLSFFCVSHAPLSSSVDLLYSPHSVQDVTEQLFSPHNFMTACNPSTGRYLTTSIIYRGKFILFFLKYFLKIKIKTKIKIK